MTASDIVSWSNPYVDQLGSVIVVLGILSASDKIVEFFYSIFVRPRE